MAPDKEHHNCNEEVFVFPASFAQQRLWFLDQLVPGTSFYNVPTVLGFTGTLNLEALKKSFNEIVSRHEILRTTFGVVEGQLVQLIATSQGISLPVVNLQDLPAVEQEVAVQQQMTQEMQQPFDLSQGPLLRLLLLQLDRTEHVLVINLHHIIFDEWSSGLLIRELGMLYAGLVAGETPAQIELPELPIQYADFTQWQREWLQGEVLRSQISYWRQQLSHLSTLEMPSDRPRPPQQSYRGATQLVELPQSLMTALESLSQQEGATLFMTLLAAFQVLLSRYTGQADIAVGSPIANRNRSELEDLIGFFANSLVLRTDLSGNPSFRELLGRVRQMALAAYAHQDLPFEKLVEEVHPERDLSRNPLFQVVFALQNAPMAQLDLPGLTLSSLNVETRTTRFDLELYLWECSENFRSLWGNGWQQTEGLRGVLVYSTDLFEAATIARFCQHFQTLLEGIVAHPAAQLSQLPILTATEQQQLRDWNQTQTEYPAHQGIHQLFEQQVQQTPEAIAVQFSYQQITYQQLNQGSNQLTHYLQQRGVGAGSLVGICLERSPEAVAAMLAILKAGAAYVPLDPSYPAERLRFMLEDAQVSVVLTHQQWADWLSGCGAKVICLEREWEAIAQESEDNPNHCPSADNLAYVIYTSGSTGTPKGVAVPHRAVTRLVCNTNYVKLNASDRVAQVANLAFDAATFEVWGALLNGATLVGIERDVALAPTELAIQLQQQQISVLFLTTALFNQIVNQVPDAFSSLRYLLFGGEMVDLKSVRQVLQQGKPQHLLHVYGPTENTTFTSWYEVQDISPEATTIPIGKAIANTQIYLLDRDFNPVPIGVVGEIYLGGDGLAQGYLNRPELTAERFIPNPVVDSRRGNPPVVAPHADAVGTGAFNRIDTGVHKRVGIGSLPLPGDHAIIQQPEALPVPHTPYSSRLYKTGDLARYRPDGNLEFLGRVDQQVKIRGFRIELGEIEAVLSQHPAVREIVVVIREVEGDRQLIAYVVPDLHQVLTISELRDFLKAKLPPYMVPAAFVILETLPLTPNGKVDRRALPPPNFIQAELALKYTPPRTSIEEELMTIWSKLLGRERVGMDDNFFELGGHSLLATQLISQVRDRFQVEVPLRSLFATPTIAELAQCIEAANEAQPEFQSVGFEARSQLREEAEF